MRRERRQFTDEFKAAAVERLGEGIDAIDLSGLYQRGDAAPCPATLIMACEERVFPIEGKRSD